ncbi:STAS/SEC14 domain-containing protein [Pseudooceanicola sp.]|uniref:STAS/SEC14 domain-containing protein n=1 Tax=Pseudooceanicola sp. TaxID=1914328 RepID=UPI002608B6A7|nr:STAS/SEC14 domain-containing protein [Pseudooceanicola sp.]MDF1854737.1 STAS/SEC14 domain-containing protein [Pseudooceanicola sp.]
MITLDTSNSPLLRIKVIGEVTRDEVRRFYPEFHKALDSAGRAGLLVDLEEFTDVSAGAMLEDVLHEMGLLGELSKMPRCALITDNRVMAGLVRYLNPIVPRMQVRAFGAKERAEAEAWAGDLTEKPRKPETPGLRMLESGDDDVLAFELDGYMDDDQIEALVRPFRERLDKGGKFNALVRLKHFGGFDPELLFDKSLIGMKWDAVQALDRYAIVTDSGWVRPFVGFARLVSRVDIRIFPMAEEAEAWAWVKEPMSETA